MTHAHASRRSAPSTAADTDFCAGAGPMLGRTGGVCAVLCFGGEGGWSEGARGLGGTCMHCVGALVRQRRKAWCVGVWHKVNQCK
jgi:hypothetical protein